MALLVPCPGWLLNLERFLNRRRLRIRRQSANLPGRGHSECRRVAGLAWHRRSSLLRQSRPPVSARSVGARLGYAHLRDRAFLLFAVDLPSRIHAQLRRGRIQGVSREVQRKGGKGHRRQCRDCKIRRAPRRRDDEGREAAERHGVSTPESSPGRRADSAAKSTGFRCGFPLNIAYRTRTTGQAEAVIDRVSYEVGFLGSPGELWRAGAFGCNPDFQRESCSGRKNNVWYDA